MEIKRMDKFVTLFLVLGFVVYCNGIVPSIASSPHEFPSFVAILYNGYQACGGVLISEDFVMTTASCVARPFSQNLFTVVAGSNNLALNEETQQRVTVESITIHPSYFKQLTKDGTRDIALLKMATPFNLTAEIQLIDLPSDSNNDTQLYSSPDCYVMGYGHATTDQMYQKQPLLNSYVPVVFTPEECNKAYVHTFPSGPGYNTDYQLCSINFDSDPTSTCDGDEGGPLICKYDNNDMIIKSYVHGLVQSGFCQGAMPVFYTRVSAFTDWITTMIANA